MSNFKRNAIGLASATELFVSHLQFVVRCYVKHRLKVRLHYVVTGM